MRPYKALLGSVAVAVAVAVAFAFAVAVAVAVAVAATFRMGDGRRVPLLSAFMLYVDCNRRMWVSWFLPVHVELQSSGDCLFLSFGNSL